VHDLQYRTYPQYFSKPKLRYLSWMMPRSCRRAAVVTVPTEHVKQSVIDAFAVPADKVVVVPHGVEATIGADSTPASVLRTRYRLGDGPVIVYPAVTHPHKGHRFLLEVMARHWHDPELRLVLIGGRGSEDAAVLQAIDELGLAGRVVRPGRVPREDRDGLLALASALVFPSEFEGFGAPVIEAMAVGLPVVCSDRASLPEVAGDAALVLPLTEDAWAGALDEVARRRGELIARGRARAAQFTLAASGAALVRAYRQAAQ
jgi:alpha-1,3-rhamnosyl/mannosyltransferase